MAEMDDKLGAILNNPAMMQQIMAMAQNLGQQVPPSQEPPPPPFDPNMIQQVMGLSSQTSIDSNQQALLTALNPYLPHQRLSKLEKAMRAAKLARVASALLNQGGGFHL